EDGIRDRNVTGVQTCALPICKSPGDPPEAAAGRSAPLAGRRAVGSRKALLSSENRGSVPPSHDPQPPAQLVADTLQIAAAQQGRSEEHTSELQSRFDLVCRAL